MILYTPPKQDFTIIPNRILKNPNLSAYARLIAIYIISLPKSWNVNLAHIAKEVGITERSIGKYIKELIVAGILEKTQLKNEDGTFSKDTIYSFENQEAQNQEVKTESKQEMLDFEEMALEDLESYIKTQEQQTKAEVQNLDSQKLDSQNLQEPKLRDSHRSEKNPHADNFHPYKELNNIKRTNIYLLRTPNQIKLLNLCLNTKKQERLMPKGLNQAELQAFSDFVAYRNEKKKITLSTHNAIVKKFENLKAQGVDVISAVEKSILNGWQGIFAPANKQNFFNTKPKPSGIDWLEVYRQKTGKSLGVMA